MIRKLLVVVASLVTSGFAAVAGEAAVTTNVTIPSEFVFIDPCTNESVFVSGDVHLVFSSTVTDNSITSHTHSDFKATGVGLSSGLQYQLVSMGNGVSNASLQNGEFVSATGARINIVTPGGENNQWSPIALHTTLDADGNLRSFRLDIPPLICR
jgi:hypothetical protein